MPPRNSRHALAYQFHDDRDNCAPDARGFPNNVSWIVFNLTGKLDGKSEETVRDGCNRVGFQDRETGFPLDGSTDGSFLSSFMETGKV